MNTYKQDECRPEKPDSAERERINAAASRVLKLFPGPIGEYLAADLWSWELMSLRYDQKGLTARMIDAVLDSPLPGGVA